MSLSGQCREGSRPPPDPVGVRRGDRPAGLRVRVVRAGDVVHAVPLHLARQPEARSAQDERLGLHDGVG